MRDDEIRARLRDRNPWWRAGADTGDRLAWVARDVVLQQMAKHDVGFRAQVFADVRRSAPDGGLYVLRGPRRVGKSVALRQLAADLCARREISPWQVVHQSLDDFQPHDLRRLFSLGREITRAAGDRPRIWLLDEVTAVEGWAQVVKGLRDDTALAYDTVVLTGSSAHHLDLAIRALGPGRTGSVVNPFRLLLPMAFGDYLRVRAFDLPPPPSVSLDHLQGTDVGRWLADLEPFVPDLDLAWQSYLDCGGFPRAVAEAERAGEVSDAFCRDVTAWLSPDVDPEAPAEAVVRLLREVTDRMSSPLSVPNLADAVGMSRGRALTRLNRLSATFAGFWCHRIGLDGQRVVGSMSKFYLIDPLLARLPYLTGSVPIQPPAPLLTEAVIALALAREMDRSCLPGAFESQTAVAYTRTKSDTEIDFAPIPFTVHGERVTSVPVECTWVSDGWRPHARALEGSLSRGLVATKSIIDTRHLTWAIPAGALALLLGT